jgi:hypothetical protein
MSSFFILPAELRNQIYEMLSEDLCDDEQCGIAWDMFGPSHTCDFGHEKAHIRRLLQQTMIICRQFHQEFSHVVYRKTKFETFTQGMTFRFLTGIGLKNRASLGQIEFALDAIFSKRQAAWATDSFQMLGNSGSHLKKLSISLPYANSRNSGRTVQSKIEPQGERAIWYTEILTELVQLGHTEVLEINKATADDYSKLEEGLNGWTRFE